MLWIKVKFYFRWKSLISQFLGKYLLFLKNFSVSKILLERFISMHKNENLKIFSLNIYGNITLNETCRVNHTLHNLRFNFTHSFKSIQLFKFSIANNFSIAESRKTTHVQLRMSNEVKWSSNLWYSHFNVKMPNAKVQILRNHWIRNDPLGKQSLQCRLVK